MQFQRDPASFVGGAVALRDFDQDHNAPPASAASDHAGDPVIVVGGGPSGLRAAQEVARRNLPVVLFNSEPWKPYNRVKLTPFLAGEVQIGVVYQPKLSPAGAALTQYTSHTIVRIDPAAKIVENQFGRQWRYSKLVLCLGSRPHIPPILGNDLPGVYRRQCENLWVGTSRACT